MANLSHQVWIILMALILLVFTVNISYNTAIAQGSTQTISGDDIARADKIAMADSRVINYIDGKSHVLLNYGASTNDNEPGIVRPVLLYKVGNKDQLSVTVDLQSASVVALSYYPNATLTTEPHISPTPTDDRGFLILASIIGAVAAFGLAVLYLLSRKKAIPYG
jgi:hypothetical protein